jgi:hypothetical protein
MKIQNIIKDLWKINFGSKILKSRRAPTVTRLKWSLGATSQMGAAVGPPLAPCQVSPLLLLQWLGAIIPSHSLQVLRAISRRARDEAPFILTLSIFHSLSLSLAPPHAKIFSTKLKCKEIL